MTIEEKVNLLNRLLEVEEKNDIGNLTRTERGEFQQWVSEAIDQESCEDARSLAQVFEILGNLMSIPYDFDRSINKDDVSESMDAIRALPPVTPTRKVGKWIYSGSYDVEGMLYCSNCNHEIDVSEGYFKYCPNCGADMEGAE